LATKNQSSVVVSNIFLFSPLPGGMIQFDEHIFQMGWFNHQLESHCPCKICGFLLGDLTPSTMELHVRSSPKTLHPQTKLSNDKTP